MRFLLFAFILSVCPLQTTAAQVDTSFFASMRARSIGPAGMSGRVSDVDVVLSDPNIVYVGSGTGGVWKSTDGGLTWAPIFDNQPASSIGAVAVFQANPDVVWVGTGEGNPRNSAGVGRGIFKSIDGGRTWTHLGLEASERIHRVILHPSNPDVAYVAALGPTWSDGEERGVFRTTDGGNTWDRVLYVNERTGAADLVMDPTNPDKLFAAMWEHRRWPWFFESGGPGSGLHVTYDGGDTWNRYSEEDGMPGGELGRIGIAAFQQDPRIVYALVEAKKSAMLRSDDGGVTWQTISDERGVAPRPFYYADIRVDPTNENRVYSLHSRITVSEDQGRTFRTVVPSSSVHGDVHELWIHPTDSRRLIMGNDGGIAFSFNRGETWRFVENLPLAQFYHINVDMETPYNVYGGLQDNGSWFGPSAKWFGGPIRNSYWTRVGGGDGFAAFTDFGDGRYGYSMSQQGFLRRFDKETGERKDIRPVHPDGTPLRFNWNAAFNVDPFDSTIIYLGSQLVHRSADAGNSWQIISPDLTTNDPAKQRAMESGGLTRDASGAENHTTIVSIAPSPVERGVIWVGTDDGNVQITRDGGANWENLIGRMQDVPGGTWVPHVEPSKFDGSTAYVVLDDHRRGNWTTYLFEVSGYGRTWRRLGTDGVEGFAHVIEQDPIEPNLLFLGTEFGLYVSLDGGERWWKWTSGLPTAPYRALMIHPRDHDLVLGTHGRAAYVIDDIRPLRAIAADPSIAQQPLHVFDIPPTYQHTVAEATTGGYRSTGHAMFAGDNKAYGAHISYAAASPGNADITILDPAGDTVRTFDHSGERGLNRLTWDLRRNDFDAPGFDANGTRSGPEVLPDTYEVRIAMDDHEASGSVVVMPDPRTSVADVDRIAKYDAILRVGRVMDQSSEVVAQVREVRLAAEAVREALERRGDTASPLIEAGKALNARLEELTARIIPKPGGAGVVNTSTLLNNRIGSIYSSLQSSRDAPTETQRITMGAVEADLAQVVADYNRLVTGEITAFRSRAREAGLDLIPDTGPISPR